MKKRIMKIVVDGVTFTFSSRFSEDGDGGLTRRFYSDGKLLPELYRSSPSRPITPPCVSENKGVTRFNSIPR
jgi:hypothetical protein